MKRFLRTVLLAAIYCHSVLAQYSEALDRCLEKADTQTAINACANEEASRVEVELNEIYQRLLVAARGEPRAVEKLLAAEKAWIDYRDAYMNARYLAEDKQAEYGSIFPAEFALIRAKLTKQHIEALRDLLKHYSNSK